MAIWKIEITQNDCPMVDTTRIFSNTFILMVNTQIIDEKFQYLFSLVSSSTAKELGDAIRFLSVHPRVYNFILLSKFRNVAIASFRTTQTSMYRKTESLGFRLHPILVINGKERWFFVNDTGKEITESYINDKFTNVLKIERMSQEQFSLEYPWIFYKLYMTALLKGFSEKDARFLRLASEQGFFDWPRATTLTELSSRMKLPKSTLSYRVRKLQKNIARLLSDDYSIFRES